MDQRKLSMYKECNIEFKKVLEWSNALYPRQAKENFDIDETFITIEKKYNIEDYNDSAFGWLYTFLDAFADSVSHEFEELGENYSVEEAKIDLERIIRLIDREKIEELEGNKAMINKVRNRILGL